MNTEFLSNPNINPDEILSPEELLNKYSKEVSDFFEVAVDKDIQIRVFDSMDEIGAAFEDYTGIKPPIYLKGFSPDGEKWREIWAVKWGEPDENGQIMSRGYFNRTIKHELAHTYQKILCHENKIDGRQIPVWLTEGVALWLAEQRYEDAGNIDIEALRDMDELDPAKFKIGYKIVSQIIALYGKAKLIDVFKIGDKETILKELKKMFPCPK